MESLLAVEAAARLRSFSHAGEEMNITQSAISHAIGAAEELLGIQIFDRKVRPIRLTAEGMVYVAAVTACLAQISAETESIRRRKRSNVLTISCNLAYGNYWLLPHLKAFHEAYPDLQVNMVTTYQGLASLEEGIDVAIRFGRGDWAGCEAQLLFRERLVPVASPDYVRRSAPVCRPADLREHSLLHAVFVDRTWYDWGQWFQHFGVEASGTLPGSTFDNHLLMMQAALSG